VYYKVGDRVLVVSDCVYAPSSAIGKHGTVVSTDAQWQGAGYLVKLDAGYTCLCTPSELVRSEVAK